jgi:hypothetical protein
MGTKVTDESMVRIQMTEEMNKWWAVLNTAINLLVQYKAVNFLIHFCSINYTNFNRLILLST